MPDSDLTVNDKLSRRFSPSRAAATSMRSWPCSIPKPPTGGRGRYARSIRGRRCEGSRENFFDAHAAQLARIDDTVGLVWAPGGETRCVPLTITDDLVARVDLIAD